MEAAYVELAQGAAGVAVATAVSPNPIAPCVLAAQPPTALLAVLSRIATVSFCISIATVD